MSGSVRKRILEIIGYFFAAFSFLGVIPAWLITTILAIDFEISLNGHHTFSHAFISALAVNAFEIWLAVIVLGFLAHGLIFRRWLSGKKSVHSEAPSSSAVALKIFLACCATLVALLSFEFWQAYQTQHFADDIVIPPGMNVHEAIEAKKPIWGQQADDEANALWGKPQNDAMNGGKVFNVNLPIFDGPRRELLLRHLATSCKWRVTESDGKQFAVRREVDHELNWTSERSGFITGRPFSVRSRTVLGLDGPIFTENFDARQYDALKGVIVLPSEDFGTSYFCDAFGHQNLEIYESSTTNSRIFTNRQLISLKNELTRLSASKVAADKGFDYSLMPAFSKGPAVPELKVSLAREASGGGGLYQIDAFANPGEPGRTFLKVFEATRNIRLSEADVSRDSLEFIGWSEDKDENFYYESTVEIKEGIMSRKYPARFELWFRPDDKSKPERKLLERVYSIGPGFHCFFGS